MEKFSFDGTVSIMILNHTLEGFHGSVEDEDKRLFLHVLVDRRVSSEEERSHQRDQKLWELSLMSQTDFRVLLHDTIQYQAICSLHDIDRRENEIIIPVISAIVPKKRTTLLGKAENEKICACYFNLYSNGHSRSVLRKTQQFKIPCGTYTEKGNQYKREIMLEYGDFIDFPEARNNYSYCAGSLVHRSKRFPPGTPEREVSMTPRVS